MFFEEIFWKIFLGDALSKSGKSNYKIKYRQRAILLFAGMFFWISLIIIGYKYSQYKSQQQIDNADISGWEKNQKK